MLKANRVNRELHKTFQPVLRWFMDIRVRPFRAACHLHNNQIPCLYIIGPKRLMILLILLQYYYLYYYHLLCCKLCAYRVTEQHFKPSFLILQLFNTDYPATTLISHHKCLGVQRWKSMWLVFYSLFVRTNEWNTGYAFHESLEMYTFLSVFTFHHVSTLSKKQAFHSIL